MAGKRIDELDTATSLNLGDYLLVLNNNISRNTTLLLFWQKLFGTQTAGTYRSAKLVVAADGTLQSISNGLLTGMVAHSFGTISAGAEAFFTMTVTGALVGEPVSVGLPAAFTAGLSLAGAWVSVADTVTVKVRNTTTGDVTPGVGSYTVIVHQL